MRAPADAGTMVAMRFASWCCALSLVMVACGGHDDVACTELRESEDQSSGQHVLAEGEVAYQTSPPTSGPHIAGPAPSGVLATPVAEEIQVRLLESGGVMVQYDDSVVGAELEQLKSVASSRIVVAPASSDLPGRIVATAWTWKLTCSAIDLPTLDAFAKTRTAAAPGVD